MSAIKLKTVGYLSFKTGKVYDKSSTRKSVDTKAVNKEYDEKLEQLQSKFNK